MAKLDVNVSAGPKNINWTTEEMLQLVDKRGEQRTARFERFQKANEQMHRHLLETTDRLSDYGQIAAKECRDTISLLHGNLLEVLDKTGDLMKENKDLVVPVAKIAVVPVVAGVLGLTTLLMQRQSGYKEKINHVTGKSKIRIR